MSGIGRLRGRGVGALALYTICGYCVRRVCTGGIPRFAGEDTICLHGADAGIRRIALLLAHGTRFFHVF